MIREPLVADLPLCNEKNISTHNIETGRIMKSMRPDNIGICLVSYFFLLLSSSFKGHPEQYFPFFLYFSQHSFFAIISPNLKK